MFGVVGWQSPSRFSVCLQRHRGRLEMFSGFAHPAECLAMMIFGAPIILLIPSALSGDSYKDLADHLEIFLRKAARRAGVRPHVVTGEKSPKATLGGD